MTAEKDEHPPGWRGPGVHISAGSQMRLVGLSIDFASGEPSVDKVEVRTEAWPHWLAIAEVAVDAARRARDEGIAATDEKDFDQALTQEFRQSIAGLTAAAFAIDAFFGATVERAPDTRTGAASRPGQIFETLKRAYVLTGQGADEAHATLKQLFQFRDQAVHPQVKCSNRYSIRSMASAWSRAS